MGVDPLLLGGDEEVGGGDTLEEEALRALAASWARYAEYLVLGIMRGDKRGRFLRWAW